MRQSLWFRLLLVVALAGVLCHGCGRQKAAAETSDAAFDKGWTYYRLGDFNLAFKYFLQAASLAETDAQRIRAMYSQADLWNHRSPGRDEKRAVELYKRVVEEDATGAWAQWAALALVRLEHQWKAIDQFADLAALEEGYGAVMANYPGTLAAHEATQEAIMALATTPTTPTTPADKEVRRVR